MSGWALGRETRVRSVTVLLDGQVAKTGQVGVYRPDVAKECPDVPGSATSGFVLEVPLAGVPDGWYDVAVHIDDESGGKVDLGHPRVFLSQEMRLERQRAVREILVCSRCGSELRGGRKLTCTGCGAKVPLVDGVPIFEGGQATFDPTAMSVSPYGPHALTLIDEFRDGLVLDCGSGYPRVHYANVVQFDLFRYPSTDVVGNALRLPFANGVFDAAISQAVLEHVVDPPRYSSEVYRVLKGGGKVLVDSAFLQPLHAYPHHFFNTTLAGLREVMKAFEMLEEGVGPHQKPWVMLRWVLKSYVAGLGNDRERDALLGMTVAEALDVLIRGQSKWPLDRLSSEAEQELAAGFFFLGRKPYNES